MKRHFPTRNRVLTAAWILVCCLMLGGAPLLATAAIAPPALLLQESETPAPQDPQPESGGESEPAESPAPSDVPAADPQEGEADGSATPQEPDPSQDDEGEEGEGQGDQTEGDDDEAESPNPLSLTPWGNRAKQRTSKRDPQFIKIFEPVVASMDAATVRIKVKGEQIALGTVVDADGLILTKASEIRPDMRCLVNGEELPAEVVGIHPETDLALLRVPASSLNVVQWSDQPTPTIGHWVATPKARSNEPAVGIISTLQSREIPPSAAFVGIEMRTAEGGVRITKVVNKSPAELAGLQVNDLIFEVEGQPVKTNVELGQAIRQYDVGDRITVRLLRFNEEMTVKLTLAERDKISPESQRSNQQNSMGSTLSRRRKDFPKAFQHDSMLDSDKCGGPIVDLSGKAIGINIARDGRVSSLALPVETVLPVIEQLKSGELAPAIVNREKIESLEGELEALNKELEPLPDKKSVLTMRYNAERARIEELEDLISELQERLKGTVEKADEYKGELDDVRKRLRSGERVRDKLAEELERLKTGSGR